MTLPKKNYRVEVASLKNSNNTLKTLKLRFLCICEIWGNFLKIDIFSITASLNFEFENSFVHILLMWL